MMAVTESVQKRKFVEKKPSYSSNSTVVIQILRCPIIGCLFTTYSRIELVAHLHRFHSKKSLARVVAWYSERYRLRKIE
jgi:hypothetical protein